jgi:hypothetical protein
MEDVLDLYAEPSNPKRPLVCFDEMPYQLLSDVRVPEACAPGRAARQDYSSSPRMRGGGTWRSRNEEPLWTSPMSCARWLT